MIEEQRWAEVLAAASEALGRTLGGEAALGAPAPLLDGWTARHGASPWLRRCAVSAPSSGAPASVVVKLQRPDARGGIRRERVALALLATLGSAAASRVLAHGDGFLVLEDLGRGPAVEDVLVGDAPEAAADALVALARTVGAMQVATVGHAGAFHAQLDADDVPSDAFHAQLDAIDAHADRVRLAGASVAQHWATLR